MRTYSTYKQYMKEINPSQYIYFDSSLFFFYLYHTRKHIKNKTKIFTRPKQPPFKTAEKLLGSASIHAVNREDHKVRIPHES